MWPDMTLGLLANDLNGRNERTDGRTVGPGNGRRGAAIVHHPTAMATAKATTTAVAAGASKQFEF